MCCVYVCIYTTLSKKCTHVLNILQKEVHADRQTRNIHAWARSLSLHVLLYLLLDLNTLIRFLFQSIQVITLQSVHNEVDTSDIPSHEQAQIHGVLGAKLTALHTDLGVESELRFVLLSGRSGASLTLIDSIL